jgi:hypothetical protein
VYFRAPPLSIEVDTAGAPGAMIFYSLEPDVAPATRYEGPIRLEASGFVAAVADVGGVKSAPAQGHFWLRDQLLYSVDAGDPDPGAGDADHELGQYHLGSAEDRSYFSSLDSDTPIPDPQTAMLWGYEHGTENATDESAVSDPESPGENYRHGSSRLRETDGGDLRGSYVAYRFQLEDDAGHGGKRYHAVVGLRYSPTDLNEAPLNVWLAPDSGEIAADTAKPMNRMRVRSGQMVETSFEFSSDDLFREPLWKVWVVRIAIECQKRGVSSEFLDAPISWIRVYSLH